MLPEKMPTLTPALRHLSETEVDNRTDAEIERLVDTYRPVRHEKNCWTFWHSGFKNMPRWCKRNVVGWVRRLGPEWDVRVTDMVEGSPNHALNFVDAEYLPDCFLRKNMTGNTPAQHASDMIRLPLVYLVSVWMDSGTVLLRSFDDAFWYLLENPKCPYEMFVINFHYRRYEGQILNGFIGARRGNPFIGRWGKVFFELWKNRTDCSGLRYHPLIRHLGLIDGTNADRIGIGGPKGNSAHIMVDYLAQDYCFERVRLVVDEAENWDGPAYYRRHVCFLNAEREYFKYAALMPTEMHVKLMSLPFKPELTRESEEEDAFGQLPGAAALAANPDPDEILLQQAARDWLTNISSSCLAVKFSGGYWWPGSGWAMPLAVTWVLPDHEDDDILPGTWAEWFRYASTHLQQTRNVPVYGTYCAGYEQSSVPGFLQAEAERILYAGLLEPALETDGWDFIPQFEAKL
ncbi:hypothetical protein RRF57_001121 [Xylaria bambusicola]|uniref:Capsule polysaccharide biosynthesis protein n=1 Tax=Xylaria bambusicola TaxID=326684 RepID=A0AAN7U514_9PEZI